MKSGINWAIALKNNQTSPASLDENGILLKILK